MSNSGRSGRRTHKAATTALAGAAALAASSEGYADIVYSGEVNLSADLPNSLTNLPWDVDGDGSDDFSLRNLGRPGMGTTVRVTGTSTANRVQSADAYWRYIYDDIYLGPLVYQYEAPFAEQLPTDVVIGNAVNTTQSSYFFVQTNLGLFDPSSWVSEPPTTGLFGFRFEAADGTHFGWGRASVDFAASVPNVTLFDWAWQDIPGASIAVGAVPEPDTFVLVALGAAGMAEHRRRQRRRIESSGTQAS